MSRLLTTPEVAEQLSMSPEWVREHAAELGASRMGSSPRAPLRFRPAAIAEALDRWQLDIPAARSAAGRPGPRRRSHATGVELLDLPERATR